MEHAVFPDPNSDAARWGTCPLCLGVVPENALETACCGTLVCPGCSRDFTKNGGNERKNCFKCRKKYKTHEALGMRRVMAETSLKCKLCGDSVKHKDFSRHSGNGILLLSEDVRVCPEAPCKCPHCEFEGSVRNVALHLRDSCRFGFRGRECTAEAARLCGGRSRVEANASLIKTMLCGELPVIPSALATQVVDGEMYLTAEAYESIHQALVKSADGRDWRVPPAFAFRLKEEYLFILRQRVVDAWAISDNPPEYRSRPEVFVGPSKNSVTHWRDIFFEDLPRETQKRSSTRSSTKRSRSRSSASDSTLRTRRKLNASSTMGTGEGCAATGTGKEPSGEDSHLLSSQNMGDLLRDTVDAVSRLSRALDD